MNLSNAEYLTLVSPSLTSLLTVRQNFLWRNLQILDWCLNGIHSAQSFDLPDLGTTRKAHHEWHGCARLCDVHGETFSRFVEWIYTKVYSSSRPIEEKNVPGTHAEDICSSEGDL
jgi:hypothetical protein